MTTAAITLHSQSRIVHEARRRLAVADGILGGRIRTNCTDAELEIYNDAELAVLQEEDTLRALAVAAFHATGQENVSPGIHVVQTFDGVPVSQHMPGDTPIPGMPSYLVPRITLADDLGAALDAAENERRSVEIWR